MALREISEKLASGEVQEIKLKTTEPSSAVQTKAEIDNAIATESDAIVNTKVPAKLVDGTIPAINLGAVTAGARVLTSDEIDIRIADGIAAQPPPDAMKYIGDYVKGISYNENDVVVDGKWTMVALVDTEDRPAPIPIGSPYWNSGLPTLPTWAQNTANTSSLTVGQRYTASADNWLEGFRIFLPLVPDPNISIEAWIVVDPEGPNPQFQQLVAPIIPTAGGWVEFETGLAFVQAGRQFDMLLIYKNKGGIETESARWQYKRDNGNNPPAGECWHSNANQMRFNTTPKSGSADITRVQVGDVIKAGGLTWEVNSVNIPGNIATFIVAEDTRLQEDEYDFVFEIHVAGSIAHDVIVDHYSGDPGTQGVYADAGYENAVLNENAYAIDIKVQDAYISNDWGFLAYSTTGTGTDEARVIEKANAYTDARVAAVTPAVYTSAMNLGAQLNRAEIEATITDPLPLPDNTNFYIMDPNYKWIVVWDGVDYWSERLSRAN